MNGAMGRRAKTVGVIPVTQTFQSLKNESYPSGVVMILNHIARRSAVPWASEPDNSTALTLGSTPRTSWVRR